MRTPTVLAAVVFAIACLALAWVTAPDDPFARAAPPSPDTFAIAFDIPSATSIAVDAADLAASAERDDDATWTLTLPTTGPDPTTWPANDEAVRALLTELSTQAIEAGEAPARETDPLATITIATPDGDAAIRVLDQPLAGRLPVRVTTPRNQETAARDRTGFVPADRFRPLDAGQLAALAAPRPFDTPGVIRAVTIDPTGREPFTIERRAGVWSLPAQDPAAAQPAPPSPRLDQTAARSLIESLRTLRAASVVVPADPAPPTDPFLTITTSSDLPRATGRPPRTLNASLTIAREPGPDGLTNALATHETTGAEHHNTDRLQIRLDPQAFPALPADLGSLLDPRPLAWDPGEAATLALSSVAGDFWIEAKRTLDGWQRVSGSGVTDPDRAIMLEADAVRALLDTLATTWMRVERTDRIDGTGFPLRITLSPLTGGGAVELGVFTDENAIVVTDGRVVWTLERAAGNDAARRFIDALSTLLNTDPIQS